MRAAPTDYTDRRMVIFTPATERAGGSTLLNISSLGAKQIYKIDGTMNPSAMTAGLASPCCFCTTHR